MANSCLDGDGRALGPELPVMDLGNRLTPERLLEDTLKYCTIWSYKGIDAPVVLLVDVDRATYEDRLLCHTGISRARTVLHLFYHRELEAEIKAGRGRC